ncbi:hypothetical protein NDU88_004999 [Pleurodeles waltl]|uniref:Uncharacterized protein n=1 Tax=Pleurodeles waltl TaxID=8319 RepID=A0AAV7V561_PLEWA|nr:hypothetical protein NDU88_004998 [Pleurodeles waltl]KAJ1195731.1 hypothetical protein NDU88_004999 [Pleurodeles waltl]
MARVTAVLPDSASQERTIALYPQDGTSDCCTCVICVTRTDYSAFTHKMARVTAVLAYSASQERTIALYPQDGTSVTAVLPDSVSQERTIALLPTRWHE